MEEKQNNNLITLARARAHAKLIKRRKAQKSVKLVRAVKERKKKRKSSIKPRELGQRKQRRAREREKEGEVARQETAH